MLSQLIPLHLRFAPSRSWLGDSALWLGRPSNDAGPLIWPLLLSPERLNPSFRWPEGALQSYQRLTWRQTEVPDEVDVDLVLMGEKRARTSVLVAMETTARAHGDILASVHSVSQVPDMAEATVHEQEIATPVAPDVPDGEERFAFVISDHDVRGFADLMEAEYAAHATTGGAWARGFPNIIAQGPTLLVAVARHLQLPTAGTLEMWFQHPIPVGALVSGMSSDGRRWKLTISSRKRPAATIVLSEPA